ncbi:hypothetical protein ACWEOZ_31625 [Actinoplanes sp. NPDC004185]
MIEAEQLIQRPVRREPRANPFERGAELGTAVGDLPGAGEHP